jgi:hypothetical protein
MTKYKIRRPTDSDVQFSRTYLAAQVQAGLPSVERLADELEEMRSVLFNRVEGEVDSPYLSLLEVATAYFCRGQEIDELIHKAEREKIILRGSPLYKFRTGELRAFLELTKMAATLGSRRLTQEQFLQELREVT